MEHRLALHALVERYIFDREATLLSGYTDELASDPLRPYASPHGSQMFLFVCDSCLCRKYMAENTFNEDWDLVGGHVNHCWTPVPDYTDDDEALRLIPEVFKLEKGTTYTPGIEIAYRPYEKHYTVKISRYGREVKVGSSSLGEAICVALILYKTKTE